MVGSIAAACALMAGLAACAGSVPMHPAEDANNPACADVIVRLPGEVAGLDKRSTNAQSTGAWGDPVGVELRCGIEPSGPTTDDCVNVNGVDWIIDRSNAPLYRFEAYGRSPGLEVFVNSEVASGTSTVTDLAAIAKLLPQSRQCLSLMDFDEPELPVS
ncbi:MAG: DUF3515 family protein [Leucobacter sp.]|nr:DUF3515 family protein [Leucobacter sp.]